MPNYYSLLFEDLLAKTHEDWVNICYVFSSKEIQIYFDGIEYSRYSDLTGNNNESIKTLRKDIDLLSRDSNFQTSFSVGASIPYDKHLTLLQLLDAALGQSDQIKFDFWVKRLT